MILMIDNYDSFVYNLYQLIGSIYGNIKIIRNDAMTPEAMEKLNPQALIISPGSGHPHDAGYSVDAIKYFAGKIPVLGVCLGHQAICQAFGGHVSYAKELMHGKVSEIFVDQSCPLFQGLSGQIPVARYHSLCAVREDLPRCLQVTAWTDDQEIMAIAHKDLPVYGVQFHPESVMTRDGRTMIQNFLNIARLQTEFKGGQGND